MNLCRTNFSGTSGHLFLQDSYHLTPDKEGKLGLDCWVRLMLEVAISQDFCRTIYFPISTAEDNPLPLFFQTGRDSCRMWKNVLKSSFTNKQKHSTSSNTV